jgi:hypothetical protein
MFENFKDSFFLLILDLILPLFIIWNNTFIKEAGKYRKVEDKFPKSQKPTKTIHRTDLNLGQHLSVQWTLSLYASWALRDNKN